MDEQHFFHALKIDKDLCVGCSHCVSVCPTEALRIKKGKSVLKPNYCIDCGECLRVCPTKAIYVDYDDFDNILDYKYRVALIPSIFIGQFPKEIPISMIYNALLHLGFTHVYEAENGVGITEDEFGKYQKQNNAPRPLISCFCPAVVRLIQVRFPALVDNIVLQKPPLEISALFVQKELMEQGAQKEDIGIFYITPCAAKIAAIKDPVGEYDLPITGSINMDVLFNKAYGVIKRKEIKKEEIVYYRTLSEKAVNYSLTGGESSLIKGRTLAVDEIHNVIDILEKVEDEEIENIDFLELRACDESCAGGVLAPGNKFLTVERLKKCSEKIKNTEKADEQKTSPAFRGIKEEQTYLSEKIKIGKIEPRSMMKLDDDIAQALKKVEQINKTLEKLPRVDCTLCGAPSCEALAQDVAKGEATIAHCIFIQKMMLQSGELSSKESEEHFKDIWGAGKTRKDYNKNN